MLCLLSIAQFQSYIYIWNAALPEVSNNGLCRESGHAEMLNARLAKKPVVLMMS